MSAVAMRSAGLVKILLDKGIDIEARDFIGCTPLMYAAKSGSTEMVEMLLDAGAEIEYPFTGKKAVIRPRIGMDLMSHTILE